MYNLLILLLVRMHIISGHLAPVAKQINYLCKGDFGPVFPLQLISH